MITASVHSTEESSVKKEATFSWPLVFAVGLGFMTTSIFWVHYNGFVPIFLKETHGLKFALVGFIMTMDNWIGLFLQPTIGTLSDNTNTRFGRRMPYLLIGIPAAALFFVLIPFANEQGLLFLIGTIFLFNISMAIYRSPTVALMPDLVPSEKRSTANGIINLMGGLGGALMLYVGAVIYSINVNYSFLFGSLMAILSLIVMYLTVRENRRIKQGLVITDPSDNHGEHKASLIDEFRKMLSNPDKSQLFMLLAILSWFMAWNAIESFWTSYGKFALGIPEENAQKALTFFTVSFVLTAIPGGILGAKIGRMATMRVGVLILILDFIIGSMLKDLGSLTFVLIVAGVAWSLININSIVVVWEHARKNVGVGTGVYYAFSSAAAVSGPPLAGIVFDQLGPSSLFPFSVFFLILAFIFLLFVKTGEPGDLD